MRKLSIKMASLAVTLLTCLLLMGGCTLDRSGVGANVSMKVEPALFCPGDSVTVSWDASHMPRLPALCALMGREYATPIACSSSGGCPGGSTSNACLDGFCCPRDVFMDNARACPTEAGCYPQFSLTITGDTLSAPVVEGEERFITGERSVTPSDTTEFLLSFTRTGLGGPVELRKTATMVRPESSTMQTLDFPFTCLGSRPGWGQVDMDSPVFATEHVRIASVRNTSGHIINLHGGDPFRGPVTLHPGETTDALAGVPNGNWVATLSSLDPAFLRRPRCEGTNVQDPWPDLQVELELMCSVD